jgi:hypothetical protein
VQQGWESQSPQAIDFGTFLSGCRFRLMSKRSQHAGSPWGDPDNGLSREVPGAITVDMWLNEAGGAMDG